MIPKSSAASFLSLKDFFLGFFILFTLLSDSLLIYGNSQATLSFNEVIVFFVSSRVVLMTALTCFYKWGATNRPLILFALLAATLGPFIVLIGGIALVYLGFFHLFSERSKPGMDLEEDKLHELCESLTFGLEDIKDHLRTQPFDEILDKGQDEQKYQVLTKISCHYDPLFAPLLKKALDDPSRMIKVSAATILTSLDDGFTQRIAQLEKEVAHYPQQIDTWALLGAEQYKYACSNLLDEQRKTQLWRQVIDSYLSFLSLVHATKNGVIEKKDQIRIAKTHLGLAYLQMRDYRKAYTFLKPSEVAYPLSPYELTAELALIPFYCECLFGLKQYSLLKQIAADLLVGSQKDPDLYPLDFQEALKVWATAPVRAGIHVPQAPQAHGKEEGQDETNSLG
jgi:tetratricopeptide (TPR) repeat protein